MLNVLLNALEESLFMIFSAGLLTWIIGLPIGALLAVSGPGKFLHNEILYRPLRVLIHLTQSVPYIAFTIALIPFTRWIVGSDEGSIAAIIPLTLASIPYFSRLCERSISQIPDGLIETAQSLGASNLQIIYKILIPEALPSIIDGLTTTLIHLIGYSTIAGALGGGGLGALLIHKGYQTFQGDYVIAALIALVALSQTIQLCGNYVSSGNTNK